MANALYNRVAWEVNIDSIVQTSTYDYQVNFTPENPNDPGYGDVQPGYYLIDFAGFVYEVDAINTSTSIDVIDSYAIDNSQGPYVGRPAFIYQSKNGAIILTQAQLRRLDKSAVDNIQPVEKGVIWNHRGVELLEAGVSSGLNITKIDFTSGATITYTADDGWQGGNKASISISGGSGSNDGVVNAAAFNTANGVLTLSRTESLPDVTVDLDGRYVENGTNLGAGSPIFSSKNLNNLEFKTLIAGTNVTLSSDANEITINATGGGTGTPGGTDGQIQYNNGGSFGGAGLYDDVNAAWTFASSRSGTVGARSAVFGESSNTASGTNSIASGFNCTSSAFYAFSGGSSSVSSSTGTFSFGLNCNATGDYSFAIGQHITSSGTSSFCGGRGYQSTKKIVASGDTSFNFSYGNVGHNSSRGSLASYCAILGGYNASIPATSTGSVLLASAASTATAGVTYTAFAPKFESLDSGEGIIMKSPDGTRYKVTVANGGTLSIVAA